MPEDARHDADAEHSFSFIRFKVVCVVGMVTIFGPLHWFANYCPEHHRFFERNEAVPVVFGDWAPAAFCDEIRDGRIVWGGTTTTYLAPLLCPYCHWLLGITWRKSDLRWRRRFFATDPDTAHALWRTCTTRPTTAQAPRPASPQAQSD